MMSKRKIFIALTGITSILAMNVASAGNQAGSTTLTLSDAYYAFAQKRHLNNTSMPNASIAYNFTPSWAIEGSVGVLNPNQKSGYSGLKYHGFLYTVDGLYRFTPCGLFEPYALAGVGILGLKPSGTDSTWLANINAGVGTQFFVDNSIALRVEAKDIYTMSGGKNDVMVNFGVSFLFGG